MEIDRKLFARYAYLDRQEEKAMEDDKVGARREASTALIEITNELAEAGLEFKTIDGILCLIVKETKRQTRPVRSYRYPNAIKTFAEGRIGVKGHCAAWVVNESDGTELYGVLCYTVDNFRTLDSVIWLESDAFGDDAEAAERWIREKVAELQGK